MAVLVKCPLCQKIMTNKTLKAHINDCSLELSKDTIGNSDLADLHSSYGYKEEEVSCPCGSNEHDIFDCPVDDWQ